MNAAVAQAFAQDTAFPPIFGGDELAYLWAVFGYMTAVLLCLEWLWRIGWSLRERPAGPRDPVTLSRVIVAILLLSLLTAALPDLLYIMLWPEVSPATRYRLALLDRHADGLVGPILLLAWLASRLGSPMIEYQLVRYPLPINMWPTWEKVRRPLKIGSLVLAISACVTFLR